MPEPLGNRAISRAWRFNHMLRTVQWGAGGIVKNRNQFTDHLEVDQFLAFLEEAYNRDIKRPSSYADLFHSVYHSPLVPGPARRLLVFENTGGWQELTMKTGTYEGDWNRYDIRSAYLWSTSQGLPDPKTYRYSENIGKIPGVYFCNIVPNLQAPYPFRHGGDFPVTQWEIELYNLTIAKVHYGVTWREGWDTDRMVKAVESFSCHKQVGRSFWGRYASSGKVQCETYRQGELNKEWELPNNFVNPVWAHLIVARIRARLFDIAKEFPTARVYVDSVVIQGELPVGESLGDWKLEARFNGLDLRHLNIYRSLYPTAGVAVA